MASESLNFNLIANDKASRVFDKFGRTVDDTEGKFSKFSRGLASAGKLAFRGVAAFGALGIAGGAMGLKTAAGLEQADIAFTTMLGSGKKADKFLKELASFAAKTPFEFPELQTAASSLISAGFQAKKVIPIMTTLGDVTSGMGTGSEGVQRATVALQQMAAAGRITGEDLNQLRDAGVPVFDLLSAATGKSKQAIAELAQQGKLGGEEMKALFKALESGKGLERFTGLMEKQSQSLTGMWSTFKDTLGMGLAGAIQPLIPLIKDGLGGASEFLAAALGRIPGAIQGIRDFAGPIVAKIRDAVPQIRTAVGEWRVAVADFMHGVVVDVAPFVTAVRAALDTGDWSSVGGSLGTALAKAIEGASSAIGKLTSAFGALMGRVDFVGLGIAIGKQAPAIILGFVAGLLNFDMGGLLNGLVTHWQEFLFAALALWLTPVKIVGKIGQLLAKIPLVGRFLEWGLNALKGFVDDMAGAIGRALSGIADAFMSGFRRVFPGIGSSLSEALRILPTRIGVAAIEVAEKAAELMSRLRSAILNRIGNVVAAIGELVGNLLKPFAGIAARFHEVGRNLVLGFINGIKSLAGAALSAARDLASNAIAAVKDKLEIFSPSKVTMELGQFFSGGLADGIKSGGEKVIEATSALIERVKGKLGQLRQERASLRQSAFGAVTGGLDVGSLGSVGEDGVPASVTGQISGFAEQARVFAGALSQAAAKGLNPSLIAKVAALGPNQGLTAAQAIAALNQAEVAQANASLAMADKFAANVAQTVLTTTELPEKIAREEAKLEALREIKQQLSKDRVVINVHGSVVHERDLVRMIRNEVRELNRRRGE